MYIVVRMMGIVTNYKAISINFVIYPELSKYKLNKLYYKRNRRWYDIIYRFTVHFTMFVVWLDFIPVNFTFVYQFLSMDSENDLCF